MINKGIPSASSNNILTIPILCNRLLILAFVGGICEKSSAVCVGTGDAMECANQGSDIDCWKATVDQSSFYFRRERQIKYFIDSKFLIRSSSIYQMIINRTTLSLLHNYSGVLCLLEVLISCLLLMIYKYRFMHNLGKIVIHRNTCFVCVH